MREQLERIEQNLDKAIENEEHLKMMSMAVAMLQFQVFLDEDLYDEEVKNKLEQVSNKLKEIKKNKED